MAEGGIVTNKIKVNDPIFPENIKITKKLKILFLKINTQYKAMLNKASIALNSEFGIEFSHHYGVDNFAETGALLIDCINRDYCKKISSSFTWLIHHTFTEKEETFQVLPEYLSVLLMGTIEK